MCSYLCRFSLQTTLVSIYNRTGLRARQPHGQCSWRAVAEAKQRWLVIGWVIKKLLFRAPPCFERHVIRWYFTHTNALIIETVKQQSIEVNNTIIFKLRFMSKYASNPLN
jgi:hypothetical protein